MAHLVSTSIGKVSGEKEQPVFSKFVPNINSYFTQYNALFQKYQSYLINTLALTKASGFLSVYDQFSVLEVKVVSLTIQEIVHTVHVSKGFKAYT